MAQKVMGQLGMTKAMKRASRLANMDESRARDKARQRSSYRSAFTNAKGPAPTDMSRCGFVIPPLVKPLAPIKPRVVGTWAHLYTTKGHEGFVKSE